MLMALYVLQTSLFLIPGINRTSLLMAGFIPASFFWIVFYEREKLMRIFAYKGGLKMTKKRNKGSKNQNSPKTQQQMAEFSSELMSSGDNSKGNKRNKDQNDKTDH